MEEKLRPGVFSSYTAGSSGYGSGSRAAGLIVPGVTTPGTPVWVTDGIEAAAALPAPEEAAALAACELLLATGAGKVWLCPVAEEGWQAAFDLAGAEAELDTVVCACEEEADALAFAAMLTAAANDRRERVGIIAAADDEAARQELVAGVFLNFVRLARDERLVDVAAILRDDGVGIDLVAGGEDDDVVAHELRGVHGHAPAVAHGDGLGRGEDAQLVERFLRADLLNDADGGVDDDDAHERQVQPLADCDHAEGQQEKEHIEIGEDVFLHDLPGSLARRLDRAVVQTGGDPLGHLRFAQAGLRRGEEHGDVDRRLRLRQGF